MKKAVSLVLVMLMMLSMSVAAFADGSPVKQPSSADFSAPAPAATPVIEEEKGVEVETKSGSELPADAAKLVANKDLTKEQKEDLDKAIKEVTDQGYVTVNSFKFVVDENYKDDFVSKAYVVRVKPGQSLFVNGKLIDLKTLKSLGGNKYELILTGTSNIVIARKK